MNTEIGTEIETKNNDNNTSILMSHCLELPLAFAIWQDQGDIVLISSKMQSLLKLPSLIVTSIEFVRSTSVIFGNFLYEAVEKVSIAQFSNRKYSENIRTKYNKIYKVSLRYNIRTKIYTFTAVDNDLQSSSAYTSEKHSILDEKITLLHEILDSIPVFIWYKNKNSKLLYCNKEYASAQNMTVCDVINNNKLLLRSAGVPNVSNVPQQFRTDIQCNNEKKTLQVTEFQSTINNSYIIGFATEYVDTKLAYKESALYKQYLSYTIDHVSDGLALFDTDNKLLFCNEIALHLFNLVASDVTNKTFTTIVDLIISKEILVNSNKDYRNFLLTNIKNVTDDGVVKTIQLNNGKTLRVTITVHDDKTMLFVFTDITTNLARERENRTIRTIYQNILNNIDEGIIIFGPDNRVKFASVTIESMLTLCESKTHLTENMHVRDCFGKNQFETAEAQKQFISELLISAEQRVPNTKIVTISSKTLECSYLPLPDGLNLLKFKDLSNFKSMEMDLKVASDKVSQITNLKSALFTTIADEYVAPLSTITSLAEILNNKYFGELTPKQEEYCKSIIKTTKYLKDIADAITDIALIKTDRMNFVFNETDINEYLQNIVDEFSKTGHKAISFAPIEPQLTVYIDLEAIRKAIYHIVLRSFYIINDDGVVSLSVHRCSSNNRFFEIEISDNGVGIEETDLNRYQQFLLKDVHIGDLKTIEVGYALANLIVQKHNGKLTITSEENKGTTVRIQLQIRQFLV